MKPEDFVHLHVHSHFSLLDGACSIKALGKLAKKHGQKALALTDHGNLFGVVQFCKEMDSTGVKPIIGLETYVAPRDHKERQSASNGRDNYHLTLLATDAAGYKNLIKLSSIAYLEGFYYKPRIDFDLLERHRKGLIVLSGCPSSELCQNILSGRAAEAASVAARYAEMLGKENYFIEVQDNGLDDQRVCMEALAKIAGQQGLGMVATNDIHYGEKEDAKAQEVLLCINTGKTMQSADRMSFGSQEFYFKSGQEMIERFAHLPGAAENTATIAERCNLHLDFKARHFPHFDPPKGLTDTQYLRHLCEKGIGWRYGKPSAEVTQRLNYELDVVDKMGYSSYFLIVWDIINFARKQRIPVGLRGSGNSAIVCYVLGISDVDPLKYSLIFERFLDLERREPPDLDIDICEVRREELIKYMREKYGHDNTAQIITFGTMKAKAVVKDVARALGWSVAEANDLAKRIPATLGTTLASALEQDETLRRDKKSNARIGELLGYGEKLEGLARHASTHAAGVCIADKPLTEQIPICKVNDIVMTQFAMNDLEKAGMLKMDLLGLRTLTIVDKALDLIERRTGKRLDLEQIPFDDKPTYDLMAHGDTKAVFQLGSSGIQELLRKLKPQNIEDVIAIVALYRPGPLQSGMIDDFVARRHGEKPVTYVDPRLEPILKDTCGVLVYQEQIMRILNQLGGLSLGDALSTIKAIGKKRQAEIDAKGEAFIRGAQERKISKQNATALFDLIRNFAQYGFNRSHTTPYAFLAYRTAYLKANYPMEFAAADLTCEMSHSDKLKEHVRDCVQMGIHILPPDVNEGEAHFTVVKDKAIRFGMAGVKNVGDKAVEAILEARGKEGPFSSLFNFCERVPSAAINRQALETLIKAGAFDTMPGSRAQKLAALEDAMRIGVRAQRDRRKGQKSLFGSTESSGLPADPPLPDVKDWPAGEVGRFEKEAIGMRLSFNPLDRYQRIIAQIATSAAELREAPANDACIIMAGEVIEMRQLLTKHGKAMAQVQIEDLTGSVRCVAFPETYEKYAAMLKEDAILLLVGVADRSSDRPGLQIKEALPIAEFVRLVDKVRISLDAEAVGAEKLGKLQELLQRHSGEKLVFLEITQQDGQRVIVQAGRDSAVRPTEQFVAEVAALMGEGRVRLIPRTIKAAAYGNGRRYQP